MEAADVRGMEFAVKGDCADFCNDAVYDAVNEIGAVVESGVANRAWLMSVGLLEDIPMFNLAIFAAGNVVLVCDCLEAANDGRIGGSQDAFDASPTLDMLVGIRALRVDDIICDPVVFVLSAAYRVCTAFDASSEQGPTARIEGVGLAISNQDK